MSKFEEIGVEKNYLSWQGSQVIYTDKTIEKG